VTSIAGRPGFARTGLFANGPGGLLSPASGFTALFFGYPAANGARPILFAATSALAKSGAYYGPGGIGELRGAPKAALIILAARQEPLGFRWQPLLKGASEARAPGRRPDEHAACVSALRCGMQKRQAAICKISRTSSAPEIFLGFE
jgi:hypothetical protein